ncbi:MAG: DUF4239 domain-containing protein [Candidatus Melainabacteria bacterium]|nr:MAG: DUF4239 domain-containing protein [Candidatus Melainabacteria bacterium]
MGIDILVGIFAITAVVFSSVGGLLGIRKWLQSADLKHHHDVTDPLSQTVGMMFAVLLGFMISNAMGRFELARSTVQQEAASLADVFNFAEGLQKADRKEIRRLCIRYADQLTTIEWPLLSNHTVSVPTIRTYRSIWEQCTGYKPKNQMESNAHQAMLAALVKMSDARRLRIEALHNGLPQALWWVLVLGGLATMTFTYFFGAQNTRLQVIMTAIVTLVISLNIFLLYAFDDPFEGDVMVRPTAFETDLMMFKKQWNVSEDGEELEEPAPVNDAGKQNATNEAAGKQ